MKRIITWFISYSLIIFKQIFFFIWLYVYSIEAYGHITGNYTEIFLAIVLMSLPLGFIPGYFITLFVSMGWFNNTEYLFLEFIFEVLSYFIFILTSFIQWVIIVPYLIDKVFKFLVWLTKTWFKDSQ